MLSQKSLSLCEVSNACEEKGESFNLLCVLAASALLHTRSYQPGMLGFATCLAKGMSAYFNRWFMMAHESLMGWPSVV